MSHTLEESFNAVESPLLPTPSQKRWEEVVVNEGVELTPIVFDAQKRWRAICTMLRSINAFSRARDIAAENYSGLLENLLPSPSDTVVDIIPERLSELARLKKTLSSFVSLEVFQASPHFSEQMLKRVSQKPTPRVWHTVFEAFGDPIIIILLICATLSLCFGIARHGLRGWSDGGSILVAVFLVIMVTTSSNLWPRRQFFRLSKARDNFSVFVIRNGQRKYISVFEAVVGDIICLKTGDQVPADGLFIDGNSLQVDESSMTAGRESVEINESGNPFFLSGMKVINGSARMLVTAVGINTEWGKLLSSKSYDIEERTPLQRKLRELMIQISKVGLMVASLVLVVLLVRYFVGNMRNEDGKSDFTAGKTNIHEVCNDLIGILATPVSIAATAIPEGLLLAVMITIAYSTNRMASQKALVRNLSACEAVGSADVICTDERGSLTLNHLIVSEFCFGNKLLNAGTSSIIPRNVLGLLREGMLLRSTEASSGSPIELFESQVHSTIQAWSVQDMDVNVEQVRANCAVHSPEIFNSENTQSSIWIKNNTSDSIHVHQKGQPEIILAMCSQYYDEDRIVKHMSVDAKKKLGANISGDEV
ncbi:calcium-transporting ATPase 12, plasma membrane-type-like [Coffea eugenioides]|uniref:calcium-transporting ATPase 12, plasma membrane-type-like n=1 Tax=Coffea eugenioides TaxID=49369 RepID=UPI000F60E56C|nr:calcium-transporting ATPase 12, plasma membrane-type-like [Coffea eugenioides]